MPARDRTSPFTEPLGAENFAANRANEFFSDTVTRAAEKTTQNCWWSLGRDCSCHVNYSTPKMCRYRNVLDRPDYSLLGVVRLNAKRDQTLSHALLLLGILRTKGFAEGIPQLLERDDQFFGSNVLCARFARYSLKQSRQFRSRMIRGFQLLHQRASKLLHRAFGE